MSKRENSVSVRFHWVSVALWAICLAIPSDARAASPDSVAMNPYHLARIDDVVNQALSEGAAPGCVVCVGRRGEVVHIKAYGNRSIRPTTEPMTIDTVFDLASLTKPISTATSIMVLIERGKIRLADKITEFIPEFGQNGKEEITVFQLLTHQAGLIPDNPLADYGPAKQ